MREPRFLGARRIWICDDACEHVSAETCFDDRAKSKSHFSEAFFISASNLPGWVGTWGLKRGHRFANEYDDGLR
jgi:hypothetical protein